MQAIPQRKKCMEVSGGRLTYEVEYEMPGLSMRISSLQAGSCCLGGGEVHYVSSCASGRITRVVIADIVGAEDIFKRLSCEMRDGLLKNINTVWHKRFVSSISEQFRDFAKHGGFATASVATYFAPTRSFVMCNIGNPPLLVYRSKQRVWEILHGETEPAEIARERVDGVFGEEEYRHVKTKLDLDDVAVIYGNGFAQSAFPGGGVVGHRRLLEALQDSPHTDPESRIAHLVRLIQSENPPEQDNTMVVCRATKTAVRWRDNLLAPLRLFRSASHQTQLS